MASTSQESVKLPPSSSHRLPTVSASQALKDLQLKGPRAVPVGLRRLDQLLSQHGGTNPPGPRGDGGLPRGQVAEIYGPPGTGKTAIGVQACAGALRRGEAVVWVDTAHVLAGPRLDRVLSASRPARHHGPDSSAPAVAEMRQRFHHYMAPTLPHLLALFVHPRPNFPPPNTALIVVDPLSALFDNAYPKVVDKSAGKSDQEKWRASRRFAVMNELLSKLGRMAAVHELAILVTCQMVTQVRAGRRALLMPVLSGREWDSGISTRMAVFRDWLATPADAREADEADARHGRFVAVLKAGGVTLAEDETVRNVVPFTIESSGLGERDEESADVTVQSLASRTRPQLKRAYAEIADSEAEEDGSDEEYDWGGEDELAAEGLVIAEDAIDLATEPGTATTTLGHGATGGEAAG